MTDKTLRSFVLSWSGQVQYWCTKESIRYHQTTFQYVDVLDTSDVAFLKSHGNDEFLSIAPSTCYTGVSIQAKGELRAAQAEIDELKEDKAVLGKTLDIKSKEIRMQLLQVNVLAVVVDTTFRRNCKVVPCCVWPLFLAIFSSCSSMVGTNEPGEGS